MIVEIEDPDKDHIESNFRRKLSDEMSDTPSFSESPKYSKTK